MERRGLLAPATPAEARERYEELGTAAQVVTKEVATAMEFDREEYDERVTGAVVETARDALFASLLRVTVGSREEYEAETEGYDVVENGSPAVSSVAWHLAPATKTVVAATFENEPEAAAAACRRQAFGEVYRGLL
jgi:hypothetical protein